MAWFRKEKKPKEAVEKQVAIPEGLWVKCDDCKEIVYRKEVEQNFNVCPKCGGARLQDGIRTLMQMAKVSAALARLAEARVPYVSILAAPTTGGVTAAYAMLGDLNIAAPKALIGFAGPRVIEQTIRQTLPEGFQRSEFLLEKGMVDLIIDRREMKPLIARALRFMGATPAAAVPALAVPIP